MQKFFALSKRLGKLGLEIAPEEKIVPFSRMRLSQGNRFDFLGSSFDGV